MILVTGATGRIGKQVVRALRAQQHEVRALVRTGSTYYWLNGTGTEFFFGDLRDASSLRRACKDIDGMIVCSGVQTETRQNRHDNVTVQGHQHLFEAATSRGVERAVMVSCLAESAGTPIRGFEARRKAEEHLTQSGLEHTILRAPMHEHGFLDIAWHAKDRGHAWLAGPGRNQVRPIATADIAQLAVAALATPALSGQTIPLGGPDTLTALEATHRACAVVGVSPDALRVPPMAAVALGRRLGHPFRRHARRLAELHWWFTQDTATDATELASQLGVALTPLEPALRQANDERLFEREPKNRARNKPDRFNATIYQPGKESLSSLPDGPPPRRD